MPMQLSTVLDMLVSVILAGEIAAAALIDARERRFPHALSVLLAATSAIFGLMHGGIRGFAWHALAAAAVMALLLATETLWRRIHGGAAGLGGGDVKFLAALMLADPLYALASLSGIVPARRLRLAGATTPCRCCRSSPLGVRSSRSLLCFRETGPCFVLSVCDYKRMKS
ncbi:MAG: prepilin peptidase [Collinsella intestinalis]